MCGILFNYHPQRIIENSIAEFDEESVKFLLENSANLETSLPRNESTVYNSLIPKIVARGPDYAININYEHHFSFFSSVLSLRTPFTKQPLLSSDYILQFNGELYNDDINGNDTAYILTKLQESKDISKTIRALDGEFAFVIYDIKQKIISFGRDQIGKRSLVYSTLDNELVISSVNPKDPEIRQSFTDCRNGVIYQYHIESNTLDEIPNNKTFKVNPEADIDHSQLDQRLDTLSAKLTKAVKQRIETIQPLHKTDPKFDPLYSILFSGGLDCTIIAGLSASLSKPGTIIDLLNVGFHNPRTSLQPKDAPDRKLAIESWINLSKRYPEIQFNLVEIDVPYDEYLSIRPKVIELMYPKNTEMDLSIAIAFYFASRGKGNRLSFGGTLKESFLYEDASRLNGYQSKSKVLLSGLGADELYGGYHKLNGKETPRLIAELTRQINNIHERNLQRDDKVIADNGVEVRYPFLSDDVIEFSTMGIEINYKISKFILRQFAKKIGLGFVSEEPKRAIQFGAKSAKMTSEGSKKGTDELK